MEHTTETWKHYSKITNSIDALNIVWIVFILIPRYIIIYLDIIMLAWRWDESQRKKRAAFRFYYGFDCIIDSLRLIIPNEWWMHQKCHEKKRAAFRFYYGFDCIIDYLIFWLMNNGQKMFLVVGCNNLIHRGQTQMINTSAAALQSLFRACNRTEGGIHCEKRLKTVGFP